MALETILTVRAGRRLAIAAALALALVAIATRSGRRSLPSTCHRDSYSIEYQVCVLDEAGRPLAGVTVYAQYTRYSGSGPYTDSAGSTTTDATGLATFGRPPELGGQPRPMWAIAARAGWPPQAEEEPGTIVLGPPRTLRGVLRFARPCANADTRVGVDDEWAYSMFAPRPAYSHLDLHGDQSFTIEDLGPGSYHLSVDACDHEDSQQWSGDVRGRELVGRTLEVPLALGL